MLSIRSWLLRFLIFASAVGMLPAVHAGTPAQIGVFRNGHWFLDANGNGIWDEGDIHYVFGQAGDRPVVGDWNGDGITKIGVFRNGLWWLDFNGNGVWDEGVDKVYTFGNSGDVPAIGDWNGDGRSKIGVSRWFVGFWLDINGDGDFTEANDQFFPYDSGKFVWGVPGQWHQGDPVTRLGRFIGGKWLVDQNGDGKSAGDTEYFFGLEHDAGVAGDWNGDGLTKIGVFRDGTWSLDYNGNFAWDGPSIDREIKFGLRGDWPLAGKRWR